MHNPFLFIICMYQYITEDLVNGAIVDVRKKSIGFYLQESASCVLCKNIDPPTMETAEPPMHLHLLTAIMSN